MLYIRTSKNANLTNIQTGHPNTQPQVAIDLRHKPPYLCLFKAYLNAHNSESKVCIENVGVKISMPKFCSEYLLFNFHRKNCRIFDQDQAAQLKVISVNNYFKTNASSNALLLFRGPASSMVEQSLHQNTSSTDQGRIKQTSYFCPCNIFCTKCLTSMLQNFSKITPSINVLL